VSGGTRDEMTGSSSDDLIYWHFGYNMSRDGHPLLICDVTAPAPATGHTENTACSTVACSNRVYRAVAWQSVDQIHYNSFALLQLKAIVPIKFLCHAMNDFCTLHDGTQAGSPAVITGVRGDGFCIWSFVFKDLVIS
jgi:hypothetical protein